MNDITKALDTIEDAIIHEYHAVSSALFAARQLSSGEDVAEETFALIENLEHVAKTTSQLAKRLAHSQHNLQMLVHQCRDLSAELNRLLLS